MKAFNYIANQPVTTEGEFPSRVVWLLDNTSVVLSSLIGDWVMLVGGAVDGLPEAGFCGGASVLTAVLQSSTKTNKKITCIIYTDQVFMQFQNTVF